MRLRTAIALLVAAAVLPVVVVFATLLEVMLTRQARQIFELGAQETTRAMALASARELDLAVMFLEAIASSPALDGPDVALFREQAERFRVSRAGWSEIFLADPTGAIVFSTQVSDGEVEAPPSGMSLLRTEAYFQRDARRTAAARIIGRSSNRTPEAPCLPSGAAVDKAPRQGMSRRCRKC